MHCDLLGQYGNSRRIESGKRIRHVPVVEEGKLFGMISSGGADGRCVMLVGVIADTHDRLPMIDAALVLFSRRNVEAVIHPGDFVAPFAVRRLLQYDGPLHVTYGNNDGERSGLKELMPQIEAGPLFLELGGRKILVYHFVDWCDPKDIDQADIIVTGHTHAVVNRFEDSKLFLNPGECCGWVSGRCTVAILDTEGPSAEVCELGLAKEPNLAT